jgi:5-methylcytosine-specific restriction endonuclease McrA
MVHGRRDPRLTRKYKAQRLIVLARDGYVCTYCGQDANTVDHIVAIKNGGDPISLDNMISCCSRCNSKKGSRSQAVFLAQASTPPAFPKQISPITAVTVQTGPCLGQPAQGPTG